MTETGRATSEVLWQATLIAVLIDVPLLIIVARGVSSGLFCKLKWHLVGAAFVVYAVLWGTFGSLYYWYTVYKAIFPAWARWWLPVAYGLLFGALALAFWRASVRAAQSGQAPAAPMRSSRIRNPRRRKRVFRHL